MKAAAVIVLIASTTGTGLAFVNRAKQRTLICSELITLCDMLMVDISFRNIPLTELLKTYEFKHLDFLTIDNIRRKGMVTSVLNNAENAELSEFLYGLGKTDTANQLKLINGYKEKLRQMSVKYDEQYKKNSKLFLSFGFFSGAVLSLIML